jgi:hypothetical protein
MRAGVIAAALAVAGVLGACAEKAQTAGQRKSDVAAARGADPAYTAGVWQAGDAAAWEKQLRTRAQGQNEYARSAP